MNSLKNLKESMGCNTIRDDHGGGVIYQHVHMDKAEFDEMLAEVEEEYSGLQAENAKLRELADAVKEFVEDTNCGDCPFRRECDDKNHIFCADDFSYHAFAAMRELGIEA